MLCAELEQVGLIKVGNIPSHVLNKKTLVQGGSGSFWKFQGTPESTEPALRNEHDVRALYITVQNVSAGKFELYQSAACAVAAFGSHSGNLTAMTSFSCSDLPVCQLLQEHVYCSLELSHMNYPVGTSSYRLLLGNLCHLKIAGYTTSYF